MPTLFSPEQAAKEIGVSKTQLLIWISRGRLIPTIRGGKGPGHGHRYSETLVSKAKRYIQDRRVLDETVLKD